MTVSLWGIWSGCRDLNPGPLAPQASGDQRFIGDRLHSIELSAPLVGTVMARNPCHPAGKWHGGEVARRHIPRFGVLRPSSPFFDVYSGPTGRRRWSRRPGVEPVHKGFADLCAAPTFQLHGRYRSGFRSRFLLGLESRSRAWSPIRQTLGAGIRGFEPLATGTANQVRGARLFACVSKHDTARPCRARTGKVARLSGFLPTQHRSPTQKCRGSLNAT